MLRRLVAVASLFALSAGLVAADRAREKTPITLKQFRDEYELIGRLGVPLGQVVTIDAEVAAHPNQKGEPKTMLVQAIDGRPLEPPMEFDVPYRSEQTAFKPEGGEKCRLRVYESGGFWGTPPGAAKEMDPPDAIPQQRRPSNLNYYFGTQLFLVRVLEPASSGPQPTKGMR